MNPPGSFLSDEGREFLREQSNNLKSNNQPVVLETNTAHSRYIGRVTEVKSGGLVFEEATTNQQICVPWESVGYLTGIAQARGAATGR
jgi:hypothetical protein